MFTATEWFKVCSSSLQRLQLESMHRDDEAHQAERQKYLDELKSELKELQLENKGLACLLRFVYKKFPPKNPQHRLDEADLADSSKRKHVLLKAIQHYHPDKQNRDDHGTKWVVLCEEITKFLNRRYEEYKGCMPFNLLKPGSAKRKKTSQQQDNKKPTTEEKTTQQKNDEKSTKENETAPQKDNQKPMTEEETTPQKDNQKPMTEEEMAPQKNNQKPETEKETMPQKDDEEPPMKKKKPTVKKEKPMMKKKKPMVKKKKPMVKKEKPTMKKEMPEENSEQIEISSDEEP